jgi:hypothetical protein
MDWEGRWRRVDGVLLGVGFGWMDTLDERFSFFG